MDLGLVCKFTTHSEKITFLSNKVMIVYLHPVCHIHIYNRFVHEEAKKEYVSEKIYLSEM